MRCDPDDMDRTVLSDGSADSVGSWLLDPKCPAMDDMTYWERFEGMFSG